jgi:hypothetical protein
LNYKVCPKCLGAIYPDWTTTNAKERVYTCVRCSAVLRVRFRRLKPIKDEESKFKLARQELRVGRSRTNWKSFKKRARVRRVDLDVPVSSLNILKIRLGLE